MKLLDAAAKAYYEGNPFMSDAEFDALAQATGYENVGYNDGLEMSHMFPMFSLQKVFTGEQPPSWCEVANTTVVSPKLDGAAVSLGYYEGELIVALTRGNGKMGRVITDKISWIIPQHINIEGAVQITGEVVAPKNIPNARNYAAGALNLKSVDDFLERDVTFIAYDIQPSIHETWTEDMQELGKFFKTVIQSDWQEFPHDGHVFRLNNRQEYANLGHTAHHPRGAFALKERPEGVITTLLDVEWQVGRSGVVSPVAILDPILVGDATVSRATLHNIAYIRELNLEIGCKVEVIRSGEIIPRIVRRVDESS